MAACDTRAVGNDHAEFHVRLAVAPKLVTRVTAVSILDLRFKIAGVILAVAPGRVLLNQKSKI
jgi:hypothetical protein